eukprot:242839-Chlamydomonas_euryale.AAC.1
MARSSRWVAHPCSFKTRSTNPDSPVRYLSRCSAGPNPPATVRRPTAPKPGTGRPPPPGASTSTDTRGRGQATARAAGKRPSRSPSPSP